MPVGFVINKIYKNNVKKKLLPARQDIFYINF